MVFLAVFSALLLATLLAVVAGSLLFTMVDVFWLRLVSAVLFLLFGAWTLMSREEEEEVEARGFVQGFSMTFAGEMGDKTQIAIIALVASFTAPVEVFAGAALAFALVTAIGVYIGRLLGTRLDPLWLKKTGGVLFLIFGGVMLAYLLIPGLPSI